MEQQVFPTLSIAGSDSSGGAGIEADLKTMSALGCYAMCVITAVTAQNTLGVYEVQQVSDEVVRGQLQAVFSDIPPKSVKVGMLEKATTVETVAEFLSQHCHVPLIVDPVMVSTSGCRLMDEEAVGVFKQRLLPLATLLTPNIPEAEVLSQLKISGLDDMRSAADKILKLGCKAVLIKGGHLDGEKKTDLLVTANGEQHVLEMPTVATQNTHGTGCTLSSAIAAYMAQGYGLTESVKRAKDYLTQALQAGAVLRIGHGHGPVNHFFRPKPLKLMHNA
ncbi:MAG: bifunctional hydroxymethylpyrimidine kinase/phosphomethylpyrimidine kinase [Prevotella sp.]|jgi:hydroxymethylpyrimidine/phosphomethylpyrimidine kinase